MKRLVSFVSGVVGLLVRVRRARWASEKSRRRTERRMPIRIGMNAREVVAKERPKAV